MILGGVLFLLPVALAAYAYALYPALLRAIAVRRRSPQLADPAIWPMLTITVPAYNEESTIRTAIEGLLALDYPTDRRHIVVISDASTDRTDDIVREFSGLGVELLRMPQRKGKSAAENAAGAVIRGEIVVNTDATIRIPRNALKALIRVFQDPTVGVASGRDVSIGQEAIEGNSAESGYVGYEMWVRSLETRVDSIVGASGCFYAIRAAIYDSEFPQELSRDFASAILAKEHGLRAVSVQEARCLVPRTVSLESEYRRKVRTMARGLETLWYKRHMMNPRRYGLFAFMLVSHKLCRWLVPLLLPLAPIGLAVASEQSLVARSGFFLAVALLVAGLIGWRWPHRRRAPMLLAVPGYLVAAVAAAFAAWTKALRHQHNALWEPTRRPALPAQKIV